MAAAMYVGRNNPPHLVDNFGLGVSIGRDVAAVGLAKRSRWRRPVLTLFLAMLRANVAQEQTPLPWTGVP